MGARFASLAPSIEMGWWQMGHLDPSGLSSLEVVYTPRGMVLNKSEGEGEEEAIKVLE
jgi:hypothetical protein